MLVGFLLIVVGVSVLSIVGLALWVKMRNLREMKNEAYRDRNLAVLGMVAFARECGVEVFQREDPTTPGYEVIGMNPEMTGQIAYHVPEDMVPSWMPDNDVPYDGHSDEEKRERLQRLAYF